MFKQFVVEEVYRSGRVICPLFDNLINAVDELKEASNTPSCVSAKLFGITPFGERVELHSYLKERA